VTQDAGGGKGPAPERRRGRADQIARAARLPILVLDWTGRITAVTCLTAMFVALLVNVVLRYAFNGGIPWAYEIHALLLPWLVAGGLVMASAQGRNIAVTLLPDMLPTRLRIGVNLVIHGLVLLIAVNVLWSSQPILRASQFQTLSTLGIKQVWGYASLIYAFSALALIAALEIVRTLAGEDVSNRDPQHASLS
jgi:TRAP-type transport system small permease protein